MSVPSKTSSTAMGLSTVVPAIVAEAGEASARRFIEFFVATIRNPHTREAYYRNVTQFFAWCEAKGLDELDLIEAIHVGTYIEVLSQHYSKATVKQHLAALRMLFDWLVTGGILPASPVTSVKGPRLTVRKGKTPVLLAEEARELLNNIPLTKRNRKTGEDELSLVGYRDRALIALMAFTFGRISAVLAMKVEDAYHRNRRLWIRLHEKGGKHHEMPCHHLLEAYLTDYIELAGLAKDPKGPLFPTISRGTRELSQMPLPRQNAWDMIRRRAKAAGITAPINNHTFRATGITAYLKGGGVLEKAQVMAAHASTRTTQMYDRREDEVSLDEVEKIQI